MLDDQILVRKVEHDKLKDEVKASSAKLKEVVGDGDTNQ